MTHHSKINSIVDHLFRHESGKMISVLSKLLGLQNLETAQDIVQDTLLQAMSAWKFSGIPGNPPAWLYRVAKNKAIDFLRRETRFEKLSPQYRYRLQSEAALSPLIDQLFLDQEIQDSQLRMIFACCHPSIPASSQIALALKTLCGLSIPEIARAFFTNEDTIEKRIYRAKEKIRTENIQLDVPDILEMRSRIEAVWKTIYLLFNEGYNSASPDFLIREELCEDAIRLCYFLTQNPITDLPPSKALLSLLCFQASRLKARLDDHGNIILLKFQDRSKWYRPLMEKGLNYLESSIGSGAISVYQVEAAIASLHAAAPSFQDTDWKSIYHLYEALYDLQPTPVVALNKAIASAYAVNRQNALKELHEITGLENYYLYHTSVGEMYFELSEKKEAKANFEKALSLTKSSIEKQFLREKIALCD